MRGYTAQYFPADTQKKSRAEVCFLEGKKKKEKKPTTPRDHINSSREPLTQRWEQQSDHNHILNAIKHAVETMWITFLMQLPSSIGLLSLALFPFSSLRHLFLDRKKAELPLLHDSPNPGCITPLPRRIWASSITQNVSIASLGPESLTQNFSKSLTGACYVT